MATHDYVIANASGAAVRSDLNNALAAIVSNNSNATAPATTYAYMWWVDTTNGQLKQRNAANDDWIVVRELDGTMLMEDGTAAAPGLAFASDLDTGFYRPTTNALGIATNGTNAIYVDASQRVGIGTSPNVLIHASAAEAELKLVSTSGTNAAYLSFIPATQTLPLYIYADSSRNLIFQDYATERMRIDSSGRLGIGANSPGSYEASADNLVVADSGNGGITIAAGTSSYGSIYFADGTTGADKYRGVVEYNHSNNAMAFWTDATQRGSIDSSGRLLVGTSTSPSLTDGQYALIHLVGNTVGATGDSVFNLGRGVLASSGMAANTTLGILQFTDSAGAAHATIKGVTDAATGSNDYPGRLVFSTCADGASTPTERMRIQSDGQWRLSNANYIYASTDNSASLGLSGFRWSAVWAANGTIQTSDERAKVDIADAQLGSDFIKSLRPVSYRWIEGGKRDTGERDEVGNYIYESVPGTRTHWGFIAQEVKQVVDDAGVDFGGWVLTDKDDPDSEQALRYDQFIAPLTKALQEALAKIETLEQRLSDAGIA